MAAASAIQVGVAPQSLSAGKAPSTARQASRGDMVAVTSAPSSGAGPSFRSTWATLLASLGSGAGNLSAEEASSSETPSDAIPLSVASGAQSHPSISPSDGHAVLPSIPADGGQSGLHAVHDAATLPQNRPSSRAGSAAPEQTASFLETEDVSHPQSAGLANGNNQTSIAKIPKPGANATEGRSSAGSAGTLGLFVSQTVALVVPVAPSVPKSKITGTATDLAETSGTRLPGWAETPDSAGRPQATSPAAVLAEEHPVKEATNSTPAAGGALHPDLSLAKSSFQAGDSRDANKDAVVESSNRLSAKPDPSQVQLQSQSVDRQDATAPKHADDSVQGPTGLEGADQLAGSMAATHGAAHQSARRPDAPSTEETPAATTSAPPFVETAGREAQTQNRAAALQRGSFGQVNHATAAIPDGLNQALERNPAGEHGLGAPSSVPSGEVSGTEARPNAKETFSAMDAEPTQGASTWIHAGPQHAEAGFQDPSLGWVGVRADLGASGIHAALVPGSGEAAQVLGSQMAGLNAYLNEHHTPVETLTLASAGSHGNESLMEQGSNQRSQQGSGQGSGQGSNADPYFNTGRDTAGISPAASVGNRTQVFAESTAAQRSMPSGAIISLMA